jgi:glycine cleavage system H protein
MTPTDRRYTKTHEWVRIDGDMAIMGITDHAQKELGDITFVESPEPGRLVGQGAECGVIESVKAASGIHAPLSGEIALFNSALEKDPAVINRDPYGEGWILKLKIVKAGDLDDLMDAAEYDAAIKEG